MKTLALIEQEVILQRLEEHGGNRTHAARSLKIGIRTLQRKLKKYGMESLPSNGLKTRKVLCLETGQQYRSMQAAGEAEYPEIQSGWSRVKTSVEHGITVEGKTFRELKEV